MASHRSPCFSPCSSVHLVWGDCICFFFSLDLVSRIRFLGSFFFLINTSQDFITQFVRASSRRVPCKFSLHLFVCLTRIIFGMTDLIEMEKVLQLMTLGL